jgi:DMSO/TMAO reductase YedYZ molybdopterin-dependent catalytic subunit
MPSKINFGGSADTGGTLNRRQLLRMSFFAGGALFTGLDKLPRRRFFQNSADRLLQRGQLLATIPFTGEAPIPMESPLGAELDGRLYTDLSALNSQTLVIPTDRFYIRTRASELLESQKTWQVRLRGTTAEPYRLTMEDLKRMAKPMGTHLMECAGNDRSAHFGMMSVTDWAGAPLFDIFDRVKTSPKANRVLISGFDTYATKSASSVPGASWVFTKEELKNAGAFLATEMNGSPLTRDHGAPVRLVVPRWYGCACIKWVNEIAVTDDAVEATSQMQEYAARTMQSGVPIMAREYKPAFIEQAAMPIRIEKWVEDEKTRYRVVGILWGGSAPVKILQIRFNPEESYSDVHEVEQTNNDPWTFWSHIWEPKQPGSYLIRLRIAAPTVVARRLDAGYYMRSVDISEV